MQFDQGPEARFFIPREFFGRLVMETTKEVAFVLGQAKEFDLACPLAQLFEFVQMLFVHGCPAECARHSTAESPDCNN